MASIKTAKKLKTFVVTMLIASSAALLLASCGGEKDVKIDTGALTNDLLQSVSFDDTLSPVEGESAKLMLPPMDGCEVSMYMGSGAHADEIVVITAPDRSSADGAVQALKTHQGDLVSSFENYHPEEVPKIQSAIIKQAGNYVVMCVTNDTSNAENVISQYMG